MQSDEAKSLLGLPPNSLPSQSQIKSAYRRKVWETHPDRFPPHLKAEAESKFKLLSEAYAFFNSPGLAGQGRAGRSERQGSRSRGPTAAASYSRSRVVRSGVPSSNGGGGGRRSIRAAASLPFLFIICGALALAGSTASRAYRRQKEAHPAFNPFLP